MSDKQRKAINFDLDTNALKQYYPGKHYRQAYRDIKKFLISNGFKHRQWSGYISEKPIGDMTIRAKIAKLAKTFPWLKKCVNKFDVTDIGQQHDLTHIITGNPKSQVIDKSADKSVKSQTQERIVLFSKKKLKSEAQKAHQKPHNKSVAKSKEQEI